MADGKSAAESAGKRFPEAIVSHGSLRDQHWIEVRPDSLVEVCRWLRDDAETGYDFLVDATAVHWPEDELPIEMVYHLYSYARCDRLRVKVRLAEGQAAPTLTALWRSADWNERETFDMFGIRFEGHPDLRRILMPDDYTDFPLRKELPLYCG